MTFNFGEAETEKNLQRLQRYRTIVMDNINNALSVETSKHLQEITVTVSEVEQLSKTVLEDVHTLDMNFGRIQRLASIETTQDSVAKLKRMNDGKRTCKQSEFT